jgi:SAM-dependent methyltransferase
LIDHSNLEDYQEPELYDLERGEFEPDGPFFLALARKRGGPVLDLGCGAGRLTIPLAWQGIEMVGVDVVPGMLELARAKARDLAIRWVEADARDLQLPARFRLIFMAGCVFPHLLTRSDQEAALAGVREHLEPDGLFAFDLVNPRPDLLVDEHKQPWYTYETPDGREIQVSGTQAYDYERQLRHESAYRCRRDGQGHELTRRARLSLRIFYPQEIETLLAHNGFRLLHRYGDWAGGPLDAESRSMIVVCTPATAAQP